MTNINHSRLGAFVVLLITTLILVRPGWAEQAEVRFCFNIWPPYATAENGEAGGISVSILREAAQRAQMIARFDELPWNRCLEMVRRGEYDAVIDAARRPEFLQGPVSVSLYTNTFWVREDDALQTLDDNGLQGRIVGLVDGYEYPASLMALLKESEVTIDYSVDDATNVRKLAFGRVDVIVGDFASTLIVVREKGLKIRALLPTHSADRLYASFNPSRAEIQGAINRSLAEMIGDGSIDRIYRDHLGVAFSDLGAL